MDVTSHWRQISKNNKSCTHWRVVAINIITEQILAITNIFPHLIVRSFFFVQILHSEIYFTPEKKIDFFFRFQYVMPGGGDLSFHGRHC